MNKSIQSQKELARLFRVSVSTVRRWNKKGCPCFFVGVSKGTGSRPRYDVNAVRAWLESRIANAGKGVQA